MHRESYSNPEIAKILNDNYVAIKVDRELNPVLDKRLINFVQATTGSAGWPLNVLSHPMVSASWSNIHSKTTVCGCSQSLTTTVG